MSGTIKRKQYGESPVHPVPVHVKQAKYAQPGPASTGSINFSPVIPTPRDSTPVPITPSTSPRRTPKQAVTIEQPMETTASNPDPYSLPMRHATCELAIMGQPVAETVTKLKPFDPCKLNKYSPFKISRYAQKCVKNMRNCKKQLEISSDDSQLDECRYLRIMKKKLQWALHNIAIVSQEDEDTVGWLQDFR